MMRKLTATSSLLYRTRVQLCTFSYRTAPERAGAPESRWRPKLPFNQLAFEPPLPNAAPEDG